MAKLAQLPLDTVTPVHHGGEIRRIPVLQTRYFAFLSYSHKDKELADWLHRELERFRVPRSLAGRLTANGIVPKRLTPIFRDQQDLSAAGDLGVEIRAALAASQFLVVLCSETAAKSRWTNAEIESFKHVRPEGCVLAAIGSGQPFASEIPGHEDQECFPPALRYRFDRRGRPTSKRAEPLAADLRDDRRTGFLKLVAGMLGVGLDELVRREQTRRQRRLAWLAAASLGGMAVTSTLAITAIQARDEARDQRRQAEGLVGFMLGDLKDKLEPIGRLDALDAVGSRALAYYQHQDKSQLSDEALAQRSRALTLMGEIASTRGDLDGALGRYREAFATTGEAVHRYPNDAKRLFDHAQNVFYVGEISYRRGDLRAAEAAWRDYRRLAERMTALEPDKNEFRLEAVYANDSLGAVLSDQRRYRETVATFQKSLAIAEALSAAEPRNTNYQKTLINILGWLADAHEYSSDVEQALAERERQLRLLVDLERQNPQDTEFQRHAMTSHRSIGRLLATKGDVAAGIKESLVGVAISDKLFTIEPSNTEWLQANAIGRFDLSDLQLGAGQQAAAAITTRSGCDIVDRLADRGRGLSDWRTYLRAQCLQMRARVALAQGSSDEAFLLAQRSLVAARSSPKPGDRVVLSFWSLSIGGDALAALRRSDEARRWWSDALQKLQSSPELRPREKGQIAALQLRLGDRANAERTIADLAATGYRHPAYLAAIEVRRNGGG